MENYFNNILNRANLTYYSINRIERMTDEFILTKEDYEQIGKALSQNSIWMTLGDVTVKTFGNSNYTSTYGELTREGMEQMIRGYNTTNKTYVDLGSGLGKTPLYGVMDHKFKYAVGVELAKERHQKAIEMKSKLPEKVQQRLDYFQNDILKFDISSYDYIFISNLCFTEEVNEKLTNKLASEAKNNSYIFASKELVHPKLKILEKRYVKMTWKSDSLINVYLKLDN